jgi:hypothetical protein
MDVIAPTSMYRGLRQRRPEERLGRLLNPSRRRGVYSQPASHGDIHALHEMFKSHIDRPIALPEVAVRVQEASPNSIWSIYAADGLAGGVAFLPLNALGLYQLIYGKIDLTDPPLAALAVRSERPVILYLWAAVARHRAVIGFADVLRQLDIQRFRGIDIWMHTVTPGAERLAEGLGLESFGEGDRRYYKHARSAP